MDLELYKHAGIATDLPEPGLNRGDLVTVVVELQAAEGEPDCAVEVFNALGEALDVHTLPASALEPASEDEIGDRGSGIGDRGSGIGEWVKGPPPQRV
jgi:hypothetical protein